MQYQIDVSTSAQRIAVMLLCVFGGLALLAAVGLYGVLVYAVSRSTREFGLRMALGAAASDVLRSVLSKGLTLTFAGVIVGAGISLALTPLATSLLYKVTPRDPSIFAAAFVVMSLASLAASFAPAWRAARIDPVQALRE